MKKHMILVIIILMLLVGCSTEAPVSPEPEIEWPVDTEQEPVEEQPQVDAPEETKEPEVPEEPEKSEKPEELEVLMAEPELPEIPGNVDEETARLLERVYAMDYSALELGGDEGLLLDFLTVALTDEDNLNDWNKLGNDWDTRYQFYDIRNSLRTFLEELELDPVLKDLFWQMEQWKICFQGGTIYSFSGTASDGQTWEAFPYFSQGVDMEGYVTPSRKNLQTLADAGENSELVPETVREEFVTFALREYGYGRELAGKYGTVQWIWHVRENGEILLEARHFTYQEESEYDKRPYDTIYLKKSDGEVYLIGHFGRGNDLPDV